MDADPKENAADADLPTLVDETSCIHLTDHMGKGVVTSALLGCALATIMSWFDDDGS
jgi:hypothetical protein